jgi:hypothetical protein
VDWTWDEKRDIDLLVGAVLARAGRPVGEDDLAVLGGRVVRGSVVGGRVVRVAELGLAEAEVHRMYMSAELLPVPNLPNGERVQLPEKAS